MIKFQYDDGGRQAAGFKGLAGDCGTRAASIATGRPYSEVYRAFNELGSKERQKKRGRSNARTGVFRTAMTKYMASIGWQWIPCMSIGSGCKVHLRADELPSGRLILSLSKHYAAVIDGVLHDTYNCSRNGTRCVYGYWTP